MKELKLFSLVAILLLGLTSCDKDEVQKTPTNPTTDCSSPTVTTNTVINIGATTASCGGNVTSSGGATVTARGVCWSTSQTPTINNSHTSNGSGTGSFTSSISGLSANTTYYVRAYATNSVGTAYGSQRTFTTTAGTGTPPTVTTNTVSNIGTTTATCGGNVTSSGGATVTARGVCWSTSSGPTVNNSHTSNGSGTGSFTSSISGLSANTTYYVRAYATNSAGTAYGSQRTFTTTAGAGTQPTVTTNTVSNIGTTTATCGGNVTSDGGATVTARGVCWSTSQSPTVNNSHTTNGSGTGSFTSSISGLSANTTYYVRAYATNSAGTAYGSQKTFSTATGSSSYEPCPPTVSVSGTSSQTVSWTYSTGYGCGTPTSFKIYHRNPCNGGTFELIGTTTYSPYHVGSSNVHPGINQYVVEAINGTGSANNVAISESVPLSKPSSFSAQKLSGGYLKFTWSAVTKATGYQIFSSTTASGSYYILDQVSDGATTTLTTYYPVSSGTTMYFKIKAFFDCDGVGGPIYSNLTSYEVVHF